MNKNVIKMVMVVVLLFSQVNCLNAQAEKILSFETGNSYLEMPGELRLRYVMGLMDMAHATLSQGSTIMSELEYVLLKKKTEEMISGQIMKIFDKYLEEHPEELHCTAASLFLGAFRRLIENY